MFVLQDREAKLYRGVDITTVSCWVTEKYRATVFDTYSEAEEHLTQLVKHDPDLAKLVTIQSL